MKEIKKILFITGCSVLLTSGTSLAATIDFNDGIFSYAGAQDALANQTVTIEDTGATLHMIGNAWKYTATPTSISPSTILEFDFRSTVEAEIQGIGFDNDLAISAGTLFQVFGSQTFGIQDFNSYTTSDDWVHYVVNAGSYFTGNFSYIVFANDHDIANATGESYFRNVTISNPVPEPTTLLLMSTGLLGFAGSWIRRKNKS